MKIEIPKSALLEALQAVQNVVSIRTTLPILSNVLIQAEKGRICLTTTDLDVSIQCRVDAKVLKGGATTLPARRLSSIVRELPSADIEIEVDDKDTAQVHCGSSFYKIMGLSEEEFPPISKAEGKFCYTLDQGAFREMLRKTAYAASTDETRFVLNGVFLSFKDNKLVMVATDGRRLALVEHEVEFPAEAEVDLILPSKVAAELVHTLGDNGELRIFTKDNRVMFEFGEVVISSKLIEGTYPNYRQVIPAQCEERVAVERETLLSALKRVSLVTTEKATAAHLTFGKNQLVVSMTAPDVGEARETIPIKYTGKELHVAFNPEYMIDPLKNLNNDEIYVELTDDLSPGVIKCDIPFLYVLMPMRVS
ncbi:MAG: DNA polymerase III subunit beta [Lentisphaerae bacterium]|nr:DNA polymerase III subunit beta [Lentisphaerota bacterium]